MTIYADSPTSSESFKNPVPDASIFGVSRLLTSGSLQHQTTVADLLGSLPTRIHSTSSSGTLVRTAEESGSIDDRFNMLVELLESAIDDSLRVVREALFVRSDPQNVPLAWRDRVRSFQSFERDDFFMPDHEEEV